MKIHKSFLTLTVLTLFLLLAAFSEERPVLASDHQISITGVADQQSYNTDVTPVIDITGSIDSGKTRIELNGNPFLSGTVITDEGSHNLFVHAEDLTGNALEQTINFIIDKTAPTSGTVTINASDLYTNSPTVSLGLQVDDNFGVTEMHLQNTGSAWSDWKAFNPTESWSLVDGNGLRTVNIEFKDAAGNISVTSTDNIILDTGKPTGILTINKKAVYTNKRTVFLRLQASDNYGLSQMRFKNAGSGWSSWTPYKTSSTRALSKINGTKNIYLQLKDIAGNISATGYDAIYLDNVAPSAVLTVPKQVITEQPSTKIKIRWSGKDKKPSSRIASYDIQYKNGTSGKWVAWLPYTRSGSANFTGITGDNYFFRARARDKAGNQGAWSPEARMAVTDYYGQFITEKTILLIRSQQRVRIYEANGKMVRTFLVSTGKTFPSPGAYRVYSKSPQSMSMNGRVYMKHMVRFTTASNGVRVGFHSVIYRSDGTVIDYDKLGQPVSHGCVRSDFPNAEFIYNFAPIGTKVWVVK